MKRLIAILLLFTPSLFAEHIYIAQSAIGSGNGSSAANAAPITFFNTASNWSSAIAADGKIGPGDTVHWIGTISTSAVFQGSGTSGNYITFEWDGTAKFSAPTWPFAGALQLGSSSWIILDGKNTGRVGARATVDGATWNVSVEATDNGQALTFQTPSSTGIRGGNNGRDVIVRNLRSKNLYVKVPYLTGSNESGVGISLTVTQNASVENCYITDGIDGVSIKTSVTTGTGINVSDCTILRVSNGIKPAVVSAGQTLVGATILRNRIDQLDIWGGQTEGDGGHHHQDGIQSILGIPGTRALNMVVAYNWLGPSLGWKLPNGLSHTTGAIFLADDNEAAYVYNNFVQFNANQTTANPAIQNAHSSGTGTTVGLVANNTIMAIAAVNPSADPPDSRVMGNGGAYEVNRNNFVGNIVYQSSNFLTKRGAGVSNYNVFWGPPADRNGQFYDGTIYDSFTQWQTLAGFDANSANTDPLLNANGTLQAGSPAIGRAPTQTLFNDDFYGNIRTGAWDAGAFQFSTGGATTPAVTAAAVNAAGTILTLTFSESVTTGAGGTGGLTLSATGGAVTATSTGGSGTTRTWSLSRVIGQVETITRTYVQPGNGIESTDDQTDLLSFTGAPVTNSSTVTQVNTPVFSPLPGAYSSTQNVTMTSSTPGAVIRYTTDGTDPTASSTQYTTPISTSLSTTYKAKAFASGFLDSPIATGAYQIGDFVITGAWTNIAVTPQSGSFSWSFRATSAVSPNDAVIALSDHAALGYTDLAVIARFSAAGNIDAFNGSIGNYAAVNTFPYVAGQAYDFVVTVNVPAHTYSLTVVQAGGSTPTTIATNYPFRSQQAGVVDLDNFAGFASLGSVTVSNMIFSPIGTAISLTGIATNPAGTQITASFNSQPSFGLGGQGGFTVSASGGATTPSAPTIGTNSITWNLSRTIGRGETLSATYVQPGNGIEAASGGADLASFAGQSAVNNSTVDLTAPIPNPSTFGIAPTALTSSTITMTATTSSDANSPPVQYFFNEVSGNAGGSDSGWQSSSTFTDAGLAAGTQYRYRVQVRDSAVPPNVTTFSQEFSATTKSVAGARPAQPFNMARANIVTP